MGLYRILLVDDEEEVRKGIIRKIEWEQLGFEMAGDAENGQEALEKVEQLKPDVVMTDIRMPYMDGLTLTTRIRQKYPSIKILIFSGYDDFEYAQQAIKLNVTEYILKPVNVEELSEILTRIRVNLDEEIAQLRDVSRLRERYLRSLPILREVFLNDLVRGNALETDVNRKLAEYGVDILDAGGWVAAVISVEPGASPGSEQKLIPISVRQFVEEHIGQYYRAAVFLSASDVAVIVAVDEENARTGLSDLLEDFCKEIRRILGVTVTIGIGYECSGLEQIGKSYHAAMDALGYKAIVGTGGTICIRDMEPVSQGKLQLEQKDEAELEAQIKFGTPRSIEETIRSVVGKMDDTKVHANQYQIYILSIVNCIMRLMQQYDMDLGQIFDADDGVTKLMGAGQKQEEFTEWLVRAACRMHEAISHRRDNTARQVIETAKNYIQEHYAEPDLSVEMLCRKLQMSPAYFSTIFRKETGKTCVAYLTDVRLNKAVELLRETGDKTYVIAQKVGYQEQNYFSYVFKKKFGVAPTRFREV